MPSRSVSYEGTLVPDHLPGIDQDIEDRVRFCKECVNAQSNRKVSQVLLFSPNFYS